MSAGAAVEVISPAHLSPGMLMPTAAAGGFMLTLDQQQIGDVTQLAQPQCPVSVVSSASSQQIASVLSPPNVGLGQLMLCPSPTVPPALPSQFAYQSPPLAIPPSAGTGATSNSAPGQFCTVLGPITSVPLVPVQSVQVMPAAVGVPLSPVFVAAAAPSTLFMVPN